LVKKNGFEVYKFAFFSDLKLVDALVACVIDIFGHDHDHEENV
jgi:hypothetical protein